MYGVRKTHTFKLRVSRKYGKAYLRRARLYRKLRKDGDLRRLCRMFAHAGEKRARRRLVLLPRKMTFLQKFQKK